VVWLEAAGPTDELVTLPAPEPDAVLVATAVDDAFTDNVADAFWPEPEIPTEAPRDDSVDEL
jgi:hypothetical protein